MAARPIELDSLESQLKTITESCRIPCPLCSHTRKKSNDKSMGVTVDHDSILYQCWHCDASGKIFLNERRQTTPTPKPAKVVQIKSPDDSVLEKYFKSRNLSPDVANQYGVVGGTRWFHGVGEVPAVGFVYGSKDSPSAVKWRALEGKSFIQDGSASTLYGLETLPDDADTLYICEGESDALALATAGYHAMSVPAGAPNPEGNSGDNNRRFAFLWDAKDVIEKANKIVLLSDNDPAGKALTDEMSRRIDVAKCYTVTYPDGCKDSSDVLMKLGVDSLKAMVESAEPIPVKGVFGVEDYVSDVNFLYDKGLGRGESTGIASVDELYTVSPGQLTVVTGLPGSGKSEFVDQLIVNMARLHKWNIAICSFENPPHFHISKLSEKISRKPFFSGYATRQTPEEFEQAKDFISDHFVFFDQRDGTPATIDSILDRAKIAVMRHGIQGLVIDPYNFVEASSDSKEHLSISAMLSKITSFAKAYGVHVWFIAHPSKMYVGPDGKTPIPNGNNISGSAAWFAKADVGMTVHRNWEDDPEIHIWKMRFKWLGKVGFTTLNYQLSTGIYTDINISSHNSTATASGGSYSSYTSTIDDKDLDF